MELMEAMRIERSTLLMTAVQAWRTGYRTAALILFFIRPLRPLARPSRERQLRSDLYVMF